MHPEVVLASMCEESMRLSYQTAERAGGARLGRIFAIGEVVRCLRGLRVGPALLEWGAGRVRGMRVKSAAQVGNGSLSRKRFCAAGG